MDGLLAVRRYEDGGKISFEITACKIVARKFTLPKLSALTAQWER